jgi:hypothetical protein
MDTVEVWNTHGGQAGGSIRLAVACVVVLPSITACDSPVETTTTALGPTATDTEATPQPASPEGFTYTVGTIGDFPKIGGDDGVPAANFWAYYGPPGDLFMQFIFDDTKPSLFRIEYPAIVAAPDAAVGLPVDAVQGGEVWTTTEFYNPDLEYPFTQTLAGIQYLDGMPGLVKLRADS